MVATTKATRNVGAGPPGQAGARRRAPRRRPDPRRGRSKRDAATRSPRTSTRPTDGRSRWSSRRGTKRVVHRPAAGATRSGRLSDRFRDRGEPRRPASPLRTPSGARSPSSARSRRARLRRSAISPTAQNTRNISSAVGIVRAAVGRVQAVGAGLPRRSRPDQPGARPDQPAAGPAARRRPHRDGDAREDPTAARSRRLVYLRYSAIGLSLFAFLMYLGLRNDLFRRRAANMAPWPANALSSVGGVQIGGGAPVVVQSMTLTKTHDVPATTAQIAALASAGCEIVRVAVPEDRGRRRAAAIVRFSPVPVIADIHFNASLALKAIEAGVAAVRINPGNIGGDDKVADGRRRPRRRPGSRCGSAPTPARCRSISTSSRRKIRLRRSSRPRSKRFACSSRSTTATSRSRSSRATCRR